MPWYLQFDGVDDYVSIPDAVGDCFINDYTLIVEIGEYTDGFCLISRGVRRTRPFLGFSITIESTRIMVERQVGGSDWRRYISGDFSYKGEPFIIAITYTRSPYGVVRAYRGTTLVGSVNTHDQSPVFSSSGYYIGAYRSAYTSYTKGQLYRWSVWNGLLSATQIAAVINKEYGSIPIAPGAIYDIETGNGNILVDSSGNDYHGTIHGATWVWVDEPAPPGRIDISTTLRGSSSATTKADRIRGLSAHLAGAATATGGTPIRIRGLTANLQGAGTTKARMNLIAALKAHLQGKATLKSNILVLFIPEGVYVIDADEIFAKDQPSRGQVVANYIEVWVNPLKPTEEPEEVYRSKDPVAIPPGATKTITIHFDDEPVTEPVATLEETGANLSIADTKYYAWGADVTIRNSGSSEQTCIIVANGRPLKVQGREKVVREDPVSIQENGLKKYEFDNPFVQDRKTAEVIAERLLSYANARRDISIEWRGDPALELADVTMIPEYQRRDIDQRGIFYITKQELEFDGGLRAKLEGRKM